jgi:hypothetical protein
MRSDFNVPYVLRQRQTMRVLTGWLINHYDLPYVGTIHWETKEEAEKHKVVMLEQAGEAEPELWEVYHLDENQLKMCNVKLKNDPSLHLYIEDGGHMRVERAAAQGDGA